jgi:hypothetical protein
MLKVSFEELKNLKIVVVIEPKEAHPFKMQKDVQIPNFSEANFLLTGMNVRKWEGSYFELL